MLDSLELLHSTSLTYNDLKPQNIMVDIKKSEKNPILIDFGMVKKFQNKDRSHIQA